MSYYGAAKKYGKKDDGKYLRLTGLWPSKNNDDLLTGKMKAEDVSNLKDKVKEALENGASLVFSLWVNTKKKSRKDPEFSLQCFVGDSDEEPRSSGSHRSSRHAEEEETEEEKEEEVEEEVEVEEEEEDAPKKKSSKKSSTSSTSSKSSKGGAASTKKSSKDDW